MAADAPSGASCSRDTTVTAAENGSALFTPSPGSVLIREICLPVQCRGMELLGFVFGSSILVCVHQLSAELWNRHDTPRVSVQKKIQDLGIPVVNCNKEQIRDLRKAGIIENFRATMVTLQDAERLDIALEYSRKKRGLVKHALKSAPTERAQRREEVRSKKLKVNQQFFSDGYHRQHLVHPLSIVVPERQGALNGEEPRPVEGGSTAVVGVQDEDTPEQRLLLHSHIYPSGSPEPFAKLLVADDASELESAGAEFRDYELLIETVPNESFVKLPSLRVPQRMEHSFNFPDSMREPLDSVTGFQHASQLQGDSHTLDLSKSLATATASLNLPLSRLSSPGRCSSSELEDQFSLHSNTSSRSLSATVRSTPERFLFLDSDSEFEYEVLSNSNHNNCSVSQQRLTSQQTTGTLEGTATCVGRGIQAGRVEKGVQVENTKATVQPAASSHPQTYMYGSKHHKVTATKLRHFAQNTSPSSVHNIQPLPEDRPESLIVSIPLHLTRSNSPQPVAAATSTTSKLRKPTALCNFATKKRALSRSPSVSSDIDIISPAAVSNGSEMGAKTKTTTTVKSGQSGRPRGRPRLATTTRPGPNPELHTISKPCTSTNQADSAVLQNGVMEGINKNGRTATAMELPAYRALAESSHVEDDQTSISSSTTTTSSTNSTVVMHKKKSRVLQRQGKNTTDITRTDSSFSLEALFSYYPPKLTVRDGELVPEQSLSLKNIDRSCLPSYHPIDSWRLGQPVRGKVVATKTKRLKHPPKTHVQLTKV